MSNSNTHSFEQWRNKIATNPSQDENGNWYDSENGQTYEFWLNYERMEPNPKLSIADRRKWRLERVKALQINSIAKPANIARGEFENEVLFLMQNGRIKGSRRQGSGYLLPVGFCKEVENVTDETVGELHEKYGIPVDTLKKGAFLNASIKTLAKLKE